MDYSNLQLPSLRCTSYLNKIKQKPFTKIALVVQPPDFSYEEQLQLLRKNYDFIQIPTLLTDDVLLAEFNEYFKLNVTDPIETLKDMCDPNYYKIFSALHAEYVFMKMSEIEIYKTTVYHVPVQPIAYGLYFDKVVVLTNDGVIDEGALKEHADEENFPTDVELNLVYTQRKYFDQCHTLITSV